MNAARRTTASRADGRADGADTRGATGARAAAPSDRLPYFPVYSGDMLSETRGWPLVARGAYYELLAAQWDRGGLLQRDPRQLRRLIGATAAEWRLAWRFVETKFPTVPGGRQNPTLEVRRREAVSRRERRRAAGRLGNAARWGIPGLDAGDRDDDA